MLNYSQKKVISKKLTIKNFANNERKCKNLTRKKISKTMVLRVKLLTCQIMSCQKESFCLILANYNNVIEHLCVCVCIFVCVCWIKHIFLRFRYYLAQNEKWKKCLFKQFSFHCRARKVWHYDRMCAGMCTWLFKYYKIIKTI